MKISLSTEKKQDNSQMVKYLELGDYIIRGDSEVESINLNNGDKLVFVGNVVGIQKDDNKIVKMVKSDLIELFKDGFSNDIINKLEGRFLMIFCDLNNSSLQVFTDRYGQFDCYYSQYDQDIFISSDISLIARTPSKNGYDQIGLAHFLTVYGYRPAKKQTFYKEIKRLGVNETISIVNNKVDIDQVPFRPLSIQNYDSTHHEFYSDIFLDAIRIRGSEKGNIVYLSSGWDSTAILGGLVHIFGPEKVRAVIGEHLYSKRYDSLNPYEIQRASKVADYYGVSLDITPFDYRGNTPEVLEKLKPVIKDNCISSPNMITHGLLADYIAKNCSKDEAVFCGEISDGAHNLGFSQYVTIFHKTLEFREYSDKMASYLYGPTFMDSFIDGEWHDDVIYNWLKDRLSNLIFDKQIDSSTADKNIQLLSSFFLNNQRFPLVSSENVKQLTKSGREKYSLTMENLYLQDAAQNMTSETVYSWYLHLYNSFHWQCGTVATIPLSAQFFNFNVQLPFYDSRIQEFLHSMPENWGRGLDLNPTKHPLKWMLQNKIDYPTHLQVGPHSYLYDTDHNFNHSFEITHHSAFTPVFKEALSDKSYKNILSDEIFDIKYLDSIVNRYINGEEIEGQELGVLFPICFLAIIDWE